MPLSTRNSLKSTQIDTQIYRIQSAIALHDLAIHNSSLKSGIQGLNLPNFSLKVYLFFDDDRIFMFYHGFNLIFSIQRSSSSPFCRFIQIRNKIGGKIVIGIDVVASKFYVPRINLIL